MKRSFHRHTPPRTQTGTVLVVAMILLLVLTMLGVTALNTTSMEERMASNSQEQARAFQAAETGVSKGFFDAVSVTAPVSSRTEEMSMGAVPAGANYTNTYIAATAVPPCPSENIAACWSAEENVANNFETVSTAFSRITGGGGAADFTASGSAASAVLVGGFVQISKK